MKYLRLHHLLVYAGLAIGLAAGVLLETEPRVLGWVFGLGAGLAGGAFVAAIVTGDALAGGPPPSATGTRSRGRRGTPQRPAWFDAPDAPSDEPRGRDGSAGEER